MNTENFPDSVIGISETHTTNKQHPWKLNPILFDLLNKIWGPLHNVISAAAPINEIVWEVDGNYVKPLWSQLDQVATKIKQHRVQAVVISPFWPRAEWFRNYLTMCKCSPILIGRDKRTFQQPGEEVISPTKWTTMVWNLEDGYDGTRCWAPGEPTGVIEWDDKKSVTITLPEDLSPDVLQFEKNSLSINKPLVVPTIRTRLAYTTMATLQENDKSLEKYFKVALSVYANKPYVIRQGRLFKKITCEIAPEISYQELRLVLPSTLRKVAIYACHDDIIGGHLGFRRTLMRLRSRFWWPKMKHEVKMYILLHKFVRLL